MSGNEKPGLSEESIRPLELMRGLEQYGKEDRAYLLARSDRFASVDCPGCGTEGTHSFVKLGFRYSSCPRCQTIYMNPRPSESLLHDYYAQAKNYDYWNKFIFPATEIARRDALFTPRARRLAEICRRHKVGVDVLLEVGAGFGTFCQEIRKLGLFKKIIALEMTPDLARTCRARGFDVVEAPVEKLELPEESVDVVVSFETIEHLFSPERFVRDVWRLLKPDGMLVLTCPNALGFEVMMLQERAKAIGPEHLNCFNPQSLSLLLESTRFEVVEHSTPGKLDAELVRNEALSGGFDIQKHPFLNRVLIEEWEELGRPFQQFLAEHGLSSHMWLAARKT